ncbi:MAG: sporulation protein [Pseudonocardiales bacterium]
MVFKKVLGALGIGGPSVDTVLADPLVQPGADLTGEVRITGGKHQVSIEHIALSLVTHVHSEHGPQTEEFHRAVVAGQFLLDAGEDKVVPFVLPLPWESPITEVYGQHLHGMNLGVRTELSVAKAIDKGDLDLVSVQPLPTQHRVLEAFHQLGFRFKKADVERGRIQGLNQQLPFYQEIEFYPPGQVAGQVNEVELTFVTSPSELVVVLEADKRGGFFSSGQDVFGRFHVTHEQAMATDWTAELSGWLQQVVERRHQYSGSQKGFDGGQYGAQYGDHDERRRGPGMGGMVAGAAAGLAGGMILGEVLDGTGEEFFGDE